MIAGYIVRATILHVILPNACRGPSGAMVDHFQVRKTLGLPAQHLRVDLIHRIPSSTPDQPTDVPPTRSPVQFECATHMMCRLLVQLQMAILFTVHYPAADTEFHVFCEALGTSFEIACF